MSVLPCRLGWMMLGDTQEEDAIGTGAVQGAHAVNQLAADWGTQSSARNEATHFIFSHLIRAQNNEFKQLCPLC